MKLFHAPVTISKIDAKIKVDIIAKGTGFIKLYILNILNIFPN